MPANRYRYPAGEGVPRQSERTASENKERAYIAASRRSDRSLEARVQSAFAASQIHKERTGKALKVTEEIVLKEEMYEEEDDLPARYQALMNNPLFALSPRASAYAITQMGMRDAVAARFSNRDPSRLDEVNRQFAQVFPGFGMPPLQQQQQQQQHQQQTSLCETGVVQSPTGPVSHAPFPPSQPTPTAQVTSPYSPVGQTPQPGFQHTSPQAVVFRSPFGSPASRIDSPVSVHPMMAGNTLSSPILGSPMHARSMSMSQVEPMLMNTQQQQQQQQQQQHRGATISPVMAAQRGQIAAAGQRRSYDEAFPCLQSPLATPTIPGVYTLNTGIPSPGMLPPTGLPATFNTTTTNNNNNNNNIQRRASAHPVSLSPGGMHPMHAAGFTTQLPANVRHFFHPQHQQNFDRSASFSGGGPGYFTSVPGTPNSQGAGIVSHTTQAQFQLHGDLRQMQREKKERKRRATMEVQEARKAEKAAAEAKKTKAKAKAKAAHRHAPRPSVEKAAHPLSVEEQPVEEAANTNKQHTSNGHPPAEALAAHARSSSKVPQQLLTPECADAQNDFAVAGNSAYNLEGINFDMSTFQNFSTDFNLDTFNMNFDDNFDINQFFTFPASQAESDNAQAVST